MARPKKRVLIFSALEQGTGALLFALETRGVSYQRGLAVRGVHNLAAFTEQLDEFTPDGALAFYDGRSSEADVRACERLCHDRRVPLLIACRKAAPGDLHATMVLSPKVCGMQELSYALGTVLARKRGPKPATSGNQDYDRSRGLAAAAIGFDERLA